jgi:hypothetical protein
MQKNQECHLLIEIYAKNAQKESNKKLTKAMIINLKVGKII